MCLLAEITGEHPQSEVTAEQYRSQFSFTARFTRKGTWSWRSFKNYREDLSDIICIVGVVHWAVVFGFCWLWNCLLPLNRNKIVSWGLVGLSFQPRYVWRHIYCYMSHHLLVLLNRSSHFVRDAVPSATAVRPRYSDSLHFVRWWRKGCEVK
jgi:hypothetical protein